MSSADPANRRLDMGIDADDSEAQGASNSLDRMLGILDLFTEEKPAWTAEAVIQWLGASRATTYRYLKSLLKAGLIAPTVDGSYVLGPRILEFDRQIRLHDPLLGAARPVLEGLVARIDGVALLCSFYGDKVLCIDQARSGTTVETSYERGRPMPMFRGATSKVILAHLPPYQQRNLMLHRGPEIAAAGLGDWESFRRILRAIRRAGYCIAKGEVDPGAAGVAAPVLEGGKVVGSLSIVVRAALCSDTQLHDIGAQIAEAARTVEARMAEHGAGAADKRLPSARSGRRLAFPGG